MIRLLTFTTLYPNAIHPRHGIFVETRLRQLIGSGCVDARVVAPVPWFPFTHRAFGRYAKLARVPAAEQRHGIDVHHPRYPVVPRFGMRWAPRLLARWAYPSVLAAASGENGADAIDAHYFYPDGVAAAILGRRIGRPVVITARGSDINLIAKLPGPRRAIRRAADSAAAIIAVSNALRDQIIGLGVLPAKVHVLRNGVDLELFRPCRQEDARAGLNLDSRSWIASVGNLVPEKGHALILDALRFLPDIGLLVVGSGAEENALRRRARVNGVADRVRFLAEVPQAQLPRVYAAVDALVLASSREGWPNVLLESMACGTPVVATDVGAVADIVISRAAGRIVRERTPLAFAAAIVELLGTKTSRDATRAVSERFSWEETTRKQIAIFETAIHEGDWCHGVGSDYALPGSPGCRAV